MIKKETIMSKNTIKENLNPPFNPEQVRDRNRKYVCHPWTPLSEDRTRLTFEKGQGYYVWDIDGNSYIDCCSLNSTCGYGNHDIASAIYQQHLKFHGTDLCLASQIPVGQLAEKIASLLPSSLNRTLFVNSGSEGVEAAIFIAASYWEQIGKPRKRLVTFSDGYHGSTVLTRSLTQLPKIVQPFEKPLTLTHVDLPVKPQDLRKPESLELLLASFKEALSESNTPPMALLIEPLLNVGGGIQLPRGFLEGLRKLCDESKTLLILDEVFTAYARTGKMFAFQHENMEPDIIISSKGLAGGYMPITAVTMKEEIYQTFSKDTFIGGLRYGHTTSGHAVACTAALATIDLIEREDLCQKATVFGNKLLKEFTPYRGKGEVVDIRGLGLVLVIEFSSFEIATKFKNIAEKKGLLLRQSGSAIKVVPPLIIDSQGIEKLTNILRESLETGGFI